MSRYIDADRIEYTSMCRARGNGMYEDCEIAHKYPPESCKWRKDETHDGWDFCSEGDKR